MTKKIITIGVLIVVLLVVVFVSDKFSTENDVVKEVTEEETEITQTLDVKHQYSDGKHVFVGTYELPSPCYTFNAYMQDGNSNNEKILKLEVIEPGEDEFCTQVISEISYKVIHEGPEDLSFRAFVNDEEYRLNTFEIPPHVDIDQFQIYIKG